MRSATCASTLASICDESPSVTHPGLSSSFSKQPFPVVGFASGVFGLFTMYMPPLFPTLLRTTGAGFCYNIGRLAAAFGTVFFGWFAPVGDFRLALLGDGALFAVAALLALTLPDLVD